MENVEKKHERFMCSQSYWDGNVWRTKQSSSDKAMGMLYWFLTSGAIHTLCDKYLRGVIACEELGEFEVDDFAGFEFPDAHTIRLYEYADKHASSKRIFDFNKKQVFDFIPIVAHMLDQPHEGFSRTNKVKIIYNGDKFCLYVDDVQYTGSYGKNLKEYCEFEAERDRKKREQRERTQGSKHEA